jgi:NADPH-dependent F420 reductase
MYLLNRIPARSDYAQRDPSGASVAIIGGTGALGHALTRRWTRAGVTVHIGSREPSMARSLAGGIPGSRGGSYRDVIASCRVIVLTVPFAGHEDTIRILARLVQPGQVVVDTTVPMVRTADGKLRPVVSAPMSAAQRAQQLLPPGVHVVSALHTVSAAALMDSDHHLDEDVLISGDDDAAVNLVAQLIDRIDGIRPLHAGSLEFSSVCEQLTPMIIGLNRRYKSRAGIKLTGVSIDNESWPPAPAPEDTAPPRAVGPPPQRTLVSRGRGMAVSEVAELAWQVADYATPLIDSAARTTVFTQLGAGEHTAAIQLALQWLAIVQQPLPPNIATRLNRWLDGYAGDPDERRLRNLAQAIA